MLLPFFLQCARDIVRLLLSHRANPNVLWSGHSPLSLAIASGNDLVSFSLPTSLTPLHLSTQCLPWAPASCVPGSYAHSSRVQGHQATVRFLPPLSLFLQSATMFAVPFFHLLVHLPNFPLTKPSSHLPVNLAIGLLSPLFLTHPLIHTSRLPVAYPSQLLIQPSFHLTCAY